MARDNDSRRNLFVDPAYEQITPIEPAVPAVIAVPDEDTVEPQEEVVPEPAVEEAPAEVEKPAFDIGGRAMYGPEGDHLSVKSDGAVVAYVNRALGVEGDVYTAQTFEAVADFQRKQKIRVNGRVDKGTFNLL